MMKNNSNKTIEISSKKKFFFRIGAFLFALLLLLIVEGLLRLADYGTDFSLFVEDPRDQSKWVLNPDVSKKYFSDQASATSGISMPFDKVKDPKTTRLFILGASTGIGYPYKHSGGFHTWLDYALDSSFPEQNIEIINTSLTAVNSYTLLDFSKQLADFNPDAVLIYTGHNEFYGVLGVASTNSLGRSPWLVNMMVSLKKSRLVQLIENSVYRLTNSREVPHSKDKTLMKKMVKDQAIPKDSDLYKKGLYQFRYNLEHMLTTLQNSGTPVYLSTIVSNEQHVKPFISDSLQMPQSADYYFETATAQFEKKLFSDAKANFIKARDLDMLRFRAPSEINNIIVELAKKHENTHLVNAYKAFELQSDHNILGEQQLLEHVHPNLNGYAILGYSFYEALCAGEIFRENEVVKMTFRELRQNMPITALDSLAGLYEIMSLKEGWPYFEQMPEINPDSLTVPEKIAGSFAVNKRSYEEALSELFTFYESSGDALSACNLMESIALKTENKALFEDVGRRAFLLDNKKKAYHYFQKSVKLEYTQEKASGIGRFLIEQDAYNESLVYMDLILQNDQSNTAAMRIKEVVGSIVYLTEKAKSEELSEYENLKLANNYQLLGKNEKATVSLNRILEKNPGNNEASRLLSEINN